MAERGAERAVVMAALVRRVAMARRMIFGEADDRLPVVDPHEAGEFDRSRLRCRETSLRVDRRRRRKQRQGLRDQIERGDQRGGTSSYGGANGQTRIRKANGHFCRIAARR